MGGSAFKHQIARSLARRKGEQGFTLLELMIALAVSTIVIGTVSIMMINATRSVLAVRQDAVASSLFSQLSTIFRDPALCAAAFRTDPRDGNGVALASAAIDVNPAAAPVAVPRIEYCPAGGCTPPVAVLAAVGKRSGGDINGILVSSMQLDQAMPIAGARWRWTLKIRTQKQDAQGVPLPGSEQFHNFRVTITTNEGSPNYNVTSCGIESVDPLSIAPPAILMTRATVPILGTSDATKDAECNEIGSSYTAATLMDLVQLQSAPGTTGAPQPNARYFTVYGDAATAYALDNPGAGNGLQLNNDPAVASSPTEFGQIACVHRTAPVRFTRTTNHAASANTDVKNLACSTAFGPNYTAANFSDLFQYGFVNVLPGILTTLSYQDVSLAGTASTCRIAFHPVVGLSIDCTMGTANHSLGCVTRAY